MKNFNRLIAILLAAAMTMGMSLTAMAEGKAEDNAANTAANTAAVGTITINPPENMATESDANKNIYKI